MKGGNSMRKRIGMLLIALLALSVSIPADAKTVTLDNGQVFDSDYYAETYPDVKAAFGTNFDLLLKHYKEYGIKEGRKPSADATVAKPTGLVSIDKLANKKSLKKKCTDKEFQAAYDAAAKIVQPLVGKSKVEQVNGIAKAVRSLVDSGAVRYTTSEAHYNDPYGYFVLGVGSCAGDTRATGLCLNMLGISYEHVNENQWSHQWCRVKMDDGTYWIVDPYGLYVGPE